MGAFVCLPCFAQEVGDKAEPDEVSYEAAVKGIQKWIESPAGKLACKRGMGIVPPKLSRKNEYGYVDFRPRTLAGAKDRWWEVWQQQEGTRRGDCKITAFETFSKRGAQHNTVRYKGRSVSKTISSNWKHGKGPTGEEIIIRELPMLAGKNKQSYRLDNANVISGTIIVHYDSKRNYTYVGEWEDILEELKLPADVQKYIDKKNRARSKIN